MKAENKKEKEVKIAAAIGLPGAAGYFGHPSSNPLIDPSSPTSAAAMQGSQASNESNMKVEASGEERAEIDELYKRIEEEKVYVGEPIGTRPRWCVCYSTTRY